MKKYLLLSFILFSFMPLKAKNRPFITKWNFKKPSSKVVLNIPFPYSLKDYDMTVDWGDGTKPEHNIMTHEYAKSGTYSIKISGKYPGVRLGHLLVKKKFSKYHVSQSTHERNLVTVEQWGDNQWLTMEKMFARCLFFEKIEAKDKPNLSKTNSLAGCFEYSYFEGNINDWDVSNVTNMTGMFEGASTFNQPLNDWDVSNVTNMSRMFEKAERFDQPLDNWDVSKVTNMSRVFYLAKGFDQPLNKWNVSNVTDMSNMFCNALTFNQPLDNWNVTKVTDMSNMFCNATAFNQPLNKWDVSKVTDMKGMFWYAWNFNQPLQNWNVSNVLNLSKMFKSATSFNQDVSNWDVSKVTDYYDFVLDTKVPCANIPKKFRKDCP